MAGKLGVISQQLAQGDGTATYHSEWWSRNTRSGWWSTNHSLSVMEHEALAQGYGARTTRSGWQSTNHSLRVTEHEPLSQLDGGWTTHSWWWSMNHSLMVMEHEPLTLNDVAGKSVCNEWKIHSEGHSMVPLSTERCSTSGLNTRASTLIKLLIRSGWPVCCCVPYWIPLIFKPVFTAHAAVNVMKWIRSNNDFTHKRVAA